MSWQCLPAEIRISILELLIQDVCSGLASYASVSREWQMIIEPHTFARIKLTSLRLDYFDWVPHRNRALVRYIWLCWELDDYLNMPSNIEEFESWGFHDLGSMQTTEKLLPVFTALSKWEPNGNLVLDIGVRSPSDSHGWVGHLDFGPDAPCNHGSGSQCAGPSMTGRFSRRYWVVEDRRYLPSEHNIRRAFADIIEEATPDDDELQTKWWQQLPLIPAVTGVLLRQQTRRRWKPATLAQLFTRLPRLQEIHYESWMEWEDDRELQNDQSFRSLLGSLASSQLRRLVLFENFNEQYAQGACFYCASARIPSCDVSQALAKASLNLEHLSASFLVDASHFFQARDPSWIWPNLTSLVLTSQLLAPGESPVEVNNMLEAAADAAMKMPKLETMEIWNGRQGVAALFRYQRTKGGCPAVISCRGTWELALQPQVIQAWEGVALTHRTHGFVVVEELLDSGTIKSHGDAIHHLKLSTTVIRPVSLQQIRQEYSVLEDAYYDWWRDG